MGCVRRTFGFTFDHQCELVLCNKCIGYKKTGETPGVSKERCKKFLGDCAEMCKDINKHIHSHFSYWCETPHYKPEMASADTGSSCKAEVSALLVALTALASRLIAI